MLNSKDVRNVKFAKSVGGYKQEEVDIFLDKVEVDYDRFERTVKELNEKVDSLTEEVETYKNSQSSIQSVLVSAQKLADQIVADARKKSDEIIKAAEDKIVEITKRENETVKKFEAENIQRRADAQAEFDRQREEEERKLKAIEKATDDCIARQQLLFNRAKLEVAAFKSEILNKFKEQTSIISQLPDAVPLSPEEIAKILSAEIDKKPEPEEFIKAADKEKEEEQKSDKKEKKEKNAEESKEKDASDKE